MDNVEKSRVSGPKKRKTMQSMRQSAREEEDDIIASPAELSYEQQRLALSREGSASRSQFEQEDLIDSDNSLSDACTDDMEADQLTDEEEKRATPVKPSNSSDDSRRTPFNQKLDGYQPESMRYGTESRDKSTNGNEYLSFALIVAILSYLVVWLAKNDASSNVMNATKRSAVCEAFYKLEERYTTVDENLWDLLEVNVRRATADDDETRQPGTVLFLHYGPTVILDGLINSVSNITAGCFGGMEPITLDGKYFKRSDFKEDFGVFLSQQKEALLQRGVMVIRNLEDIPPTVAQAFHTICDTQEPLVDRAVIYLTLDMLKAADMAAPKVGVQSATEEAEKLLHKLWKDSLGPAVLDPLITRLTENVYRIV